MLRGVRGATRSLAPPWCAWPSVACDAATGDVVGLDLSRRNLSSTVPATAARLLAPTLTSLNLSTNAFMGPFPAAVFQLRRLESLDVSRNFFNSTFLDGIAGLAARLSNSFLGPLPRGLGRLRRLERLNLGGSYFNGTVPTKVGLLRSLRFLHIAGNALTGRFPPELGGLASLEHLEIGYNAYDGGVPLELGTLTRLRYLDIAVATQSGPLLPELGGLARLEALFLFKNRLATRCRRSGLVSALQVLDLSDNQLAGAVPAGLGGLANLNTRNLMSNFLSGTVGMTNAGLTNVVWFYAFEACAKFWYGVAVTVGAHNVVPCAAPRGASA